MPRLSFLATLFLATAPGALLAAPVEIPARVTDVTLFPWGAQVVRSLAVPEGATEVLVPNLPDATDPATLRVQGAGVQVGAVTLIDTRQPAAEEVVSPALQAARDAVDRLAETLAGKRDAVAALDAKATAAKAEADFLRGLDTSNTPPAQVADLAQQVAKGVQQAEQARIAALAEVRRAEAALEPDIKALEQAKRALAALENPATESDSLLMTVSGAGTVTISTFVEAAGWTPSYDIRLDSAAGSLALDRFVSVHQATGEDWSGVALRLSTARPSERTEPGQLWPDPRRIGPPDAPMPRAKSMQYESFAEPMAAPAPVADRMAVEMQGETVSYVYPGPVTLRDGVEDLRLRLDQLSQPVKVLAEAVPMLEETAYRMAEGTNTGTEALLAGPAVLWLDGAVVGATDLPFVAAGDKLRLGFGAIDGLRLKRVIPQASEGDRGVLSKSNERRELARISVENLTEKAWALRVIDRVPYAEQEDLQITHTAKPPETKADWEDKRGVLAWEFDLAPGAVQTIALETTMRWPAGQVLQ